MGKLNAIKKPGKKRQPGKENALPELLSNSLLENILGDNINDVVGRRSDVGKRSLCLVDTDDSIGDVELNDDEQEKEELRREEQERIKREEAAASRNRQAGVGILGTLSQEELDQHYSKCIEMCNKNKVNVKNAFKLQLIDYMKLIVSNQSTKSENLTLMSCTLGASAKIYGLRVDKVYTDMVKILSGKSGEVEKEDSDDDNATNEEDVAEGEQVISRKRRKSTDSSDEEEDKEMNFEAMLQTEAQLKKSKNTDEEPQEMATLPKGLEYFLECQQLDSNGAFSLNPPVFSCLVVEKQSVNSCVSIDVPHYDGHFEKLDPNEYIKDFKSTRKCFSILDDEDGNEESLGMMNSSLAFDPSSNIPDSIRIDIEERDMNLGDGAEPESWGPDYDDDEFLPEPDICNGVKSGRNSTMQPKSFTAEAMAKLVSANAGDYSFFDHSRIDFWAGPRHWTIKRPKGGERVQRPGEQQTKKTVKKSCDLNFSSESIREVKKYYTDTMSTLLARKTILTWSKRRCMIPQDVTYSQKQLLSLMKNEQLMFVKKDSNTNMICTNDLRNDDDETVLTPDDFGVEMEIEHDDDDDHFDGDLAEPLGGDRSPSPMDRLELEEPAHDDNELIPAPQKVNKISLKYAKAQKRIDIKQLKSTMWECLDLESQNEKKEVKFSEVYSVLPEKLPNEEAAELSFPIAFMALLHMANEKTLSITGNEDKSDVTVRLG